MASDDANVRAALAHWAPRLIANGIDYNDFVSTTARVARWADWSPEWSRTAAAHEALADAAEAKGAVATAAEARVRASICHHFGKFVAFEDEAHYRRANEATIANYRKAAPALDPPAERVEVPYAGTVLPGYLRLPRGVERPPVVLIVVGLDSVKEEMNSFEPVFHARGMATLTVDGPGQGESEALPIEPAYEKVVTAIVDWLETRGDVDAARVGLVGVSLGGYYAGRAAAYEKRLAAAVSVGGPSDLGAILPQMPPISRQAFQIRSHLKTEAEAVERAKALTLKEAAKHIDGPFFVLFGTEDRLIPVAQAEALFAAIPSPEKRFELIQGGNHVCNNMPFVWRPMVADWLAGHLGA
jgi:2,6-dihydroxypseudooxynicotine hydrolase